MNKDNMYGRIVVEESNSKIFYHLFIILEPFNEHYYRGYGVMQNKMFDMITITPVTSDSPASFKRYILDI